MEFRLDDQQLELQDTVRRFCAQRFSVERIAQRDGSLERGAWRQLAELGVFGLLAPGSGVGVAEAAIVFEQLGAHVVNGPVLWTALAAPYVDGAARGERL